MEINLEEGILKKYENLGGAKIAVEEIMKVIAIWELTRFKIVNVFIGKPYTRDSDYDLGISFGKEKGNIIGTLLYCLAEDRKKGTHLIFCGSRYSERGIPGEGVEDTYDYYQN